MKSLIVHTERQWRFFPLIDKLEWICFVFISCLWNSCNFGGGKGVSLKGQASLMPLALVVHTFVFLGRWALDAFAPRASKHTSEHMNRKRPSGTTSKRPKTHFAPSPTLDRPSSIIQVYYTFCYFLYLYVMFVTCVVIMKIMKYLQLFVNLYTLSRIWKLVTTVWLEHCMPQTTIPTWTLYIATPHHYHRLTHLRSQQTNVKETSQVAKTNRKSNNTRNACIIRLQDGIWRHLQHDFWLEHQMRLKRCKVLPLESASKYHWIIAHVACCRSTSFLHIFHKTLHQSTADGKQWLCQV